MIVVNGVKLTAEQALAVRIAISVYRMTVDVIHDEMDKAYAEAQDRHLANVEVLLGGSLEMRKPAQRRKGTK